MDISTAEAPSRRHESFIDVSSGSTCPNQTRFRADVKCKDRDGDTCEESLTAGTGRPSSRGQVQVDVDTGLVPHRSVDSRLPVVTSKVTEAHGGRDRRRSTGLP